MGGLGFERGRLVGVGVRRDAVETDHAGGAKAGRLIDRIDSRGKRGGGIIGEILPSRRRRVALRSDLSSSALRFFELPGAGPLAPLLYGALSASPLRRCWNLMRLRHLSFSWTPVRPLRRASERMIGGDRVAGRRDDVSARSRGFIEGRETRGGGRETEGEIARSARAPPPRPRRRDDKANSAHGRRDDSPTTVYPRPESPSRGMK